MDHIRSRSKVQILLFPSQSKLHLEHMHLQLCDFPPSHFQINIDIFTIFEDSASWVFLQLAFTSLCYDHEGLWSLWCNASTLRLYWSHPLPSSNICVNCNLVQLSVVRVRFTFTKQVTALPPPPPPPPPSLPPTAPTCITCASGWWCSWCYLTTQATAPPPPI